ncbi:MAG: RidA family protein [Flavonifractor plautii]
MELPKSGRYSGGCWPVCEKVAQDHLLSSRHCRLLAAFNEVLPGILPQLARSCVAVKDLPKGALCEIEAVAELD